MKTIEIPSGVKSVIQTLQDQGHQAYVVGGGVRDALLGNPIKDWDICTSAHPDRVMSLFPKVIPTGLKHGTVTVVAPMGHIEITTLRLEGGYQDHRHPDEVVFTENLEEDLARRDFTVNAMAWDPFQKKLHDPFDGQKDLQKKILRTVGTPVDRFQEDALRIIRAIRFAAQLGFSIEQPTYEAICKTQGLLQAIAVERIREEFMKLLAAPKPSVGLELMRETGVLKTFLPELLEGVGIEQNAFHAYDVWQHTMHACDAGEPRPMLRLALLFHDIGKPRARFEKDGVYKFYNHETIGREMCEEIMKRMRFSNAETKRITHLVQEHMFFYQEAWSDATVRRFIRRIGEEYLQDLYALRIADEKASGVKPPEYERLEKLQARIDKVKEKDMALTTHQLKISGKDVMEILNIPPGPQIGEILNELLEMVIEDPDLNDASRLQEIVKSNTF